MVNLLEASESRILIYYRSGGAELGSPSLAEKFIMTPDSRGRPDPGAPLLPFGWDEKDPYDQNAGTFRDSAQVSIEGHPALLVYSPGEFSSFQMYNRYLFYNNIPDENWRTLISLVDEGAIAEDGQDYIYLRDTDEQDNRILTVLSKNTVERSPYNRVPFAPGSPAIYGPGRETDGHAISRELMLAVKKDSHNYYLGTNLIKGSVKVYVKGVEDKSVEINYETGELFFKRYIFPEDRIVVNYRTESSGLGGGDLFLAQGNRLFLNQKTTLELAESLRWTLPDKKMTQEAGESPGLVELAGTLFYKGDDLDVMVNTSLNISTPDTSGNLRLLGMEENGPHGTTARG
jgi:hypothetical protein